MDALIRTIVTTILRAGIYKGMRGASGVTLVLLMVFAAIVMVVTT